MEPFTGKWLSEAENYILEDGEETYKLMLTNKEIHIMFSQMVKDWFSRFTPSYNDFLKALLAGDVEA